MKRIVIFLFFILIIFAAYGTLFAKDWGKGYVNSNVKGTLKARRKPNPKTNVVLKVTKNEPVGIKYNHKSWYKIRHGGKLGWVQHKYITVTERGEDDDKIKKDNKPVPSLIKSACKTKVSKIKYDLD
jgi:uncharacterized protein YgiM (DUF1202 family)